VQMPKPTFRQQTLAQAQAQTALPHAEDVVLDARPSSELNEFWAGGGVGNGRDSRRDTDLDSGSIVGVLPTQDHPAGPWPDEDHRAGDETRQDTRPELPRRRRQQHLVPQLANDDHRPSDDFAEAHTEERAERTRDGMSAFQQGTRDARQADDAVEP
jgi:hypothetical protein